MGERDLQMVYLIRDSDKGLSFQNTQRTNTTQCQKQNQDTNQFKKLAEDLNKHSSKKEKQVANRHLKRCSTLSEKCFKAAMKNHLTLDRMASVKKKK